MNGSKLLALLLIIAGVVGLALGSITFTKETHDAKIGPMEISIKDKETVNIPVWAGAAAIIAGVLILVVRSKN